MITQGNDWKIDVPSLRKVEVLREGAWETVRLAEVRRDDVFRMFEPDGEPVSECGVTEFKCVGCGNLEDGRPYVVIDREDA